MAYAELWMPINNAIQNLNQTINTVSDRADRRQAQGLQSLLTADQLKGRQVERDLAQKANLRAERQSRLNEENMTFDQKMRTADAALKQKQWESGAAAREAQRQEALALTTPRDVSLDSFFPGNADYAFESGMADQLATALIGAGGKFNPETRTLIDANGNKRQLNTIQQRAAAPAAVGLMATYTDPKFLDNKEMGRLNSEIQTLQSSYDKMKKNPRIPGRRKAEIEYRLNKAKEQAEQLKNKKPWDDISRYEQRQQQLNGAAMYMESLGLPVSAITSAAKNNASILDGLYEAKVKHLTGGNSAEGIVQRYAVKVDANGNPIPGSVRLVNTPKGMQGSMVPGDVDDRLKDQGYIWKEGADMELKLRDDGSIHPAWQSGYDRGVKMFQKFDPNSSTWGFVDQEDVDQSQIFNTVYNAYFDEMPGKPGVAMEKAVVKTKQMYRSFKESSDLLEKMITSGRTPEGQRLDEAGRKAVVEDLKKLQINFSKTFGFVPQ